MNEREREEEIVENERAEVDVITNQHFSSSIFSSQWDGGF